MHTLSLSLSHTHTHTHTGTSSSLLPVTSTSITITWNLTAEDEGNVNGFYLSYHAVGISLQSSNVLGHFELPPPTRQWTISPVEEGLKYNITFDVVLQGQFGGNSTVQRSTLIVSTPETGNHGYTHTATG